MICDLGELNDKVVNQGLDVAVVSYGLSVGLVCSAFQFDGERWGRCQCVDCLFGFSV